MPRIVRTEMAEADLVDILFYLRARDPRSADRYEERFEDKFRNLSLFPFMGRARDELADSLRSSAVAPYVVFYRPIEDGIEVIRIVHGRRDIMTLFD